MAHVWNITDGNIYVSKNGNDTTGDGSKTNPYASINKATTVGANGNKIVIGTGMWSENRGISTNGYNFIGDGDVILICGTGKYYGVNNTNDSYLNITFKGEGTKAFFAGGRYGCKFYKCSLIDVKPYCFNNIIIEDSLVINSTIGNYVPGEAAYLYLNKSTFINSWIESGEYSSRRFYCVYTRSIKNCIILTPIIGFEGDNVLDGIKAIEYSLLSGKTNVANGNGTWTNLVDWKTYQTGGYLYGCFELDPNFNNKNINDYTLQPTSPCLFSGKNNATIGAFGLGYSFNPNSSVFTKEGGATFSTSSSTDDIVRASQTINGIAIYLFNLNAGKTSGNIESAWIDLQSIRYLLTTRLFANLIYNASGVATSRADNSETAGEKAVYYDFEFKYCLTEAEKATAAWKAVIWNKAVTIDNSNRGNADSAFVASEAKYISARFVKIKLYMREG